MTDKVGDDLGCYLPPLIDCNIKYLVNVFLGLVPVLDNGVPIMNLPEILELKAEFIYEELKKFKKTLLYFPER